MSRACLAAPYSKLLIVILMIFLGPLAGRAELSDAELNDLFSQGKDLFRQANEVGATDTQGARDLYQKSALRFERIVREGGIRNGKLFYNIGNAYFRMNDIGRAILNYRRAEQTIPNDPNLQQNLQYARDRRQDRIEEQQKTRVLKTLFFWHYDISTHVRTWLFAAFFCLVWLAAAVRLFVSRGYLHWCIGVSAFLSALLLGSLLVESGSRRQSKPGVVIEEEVIARKGDSEIYEPSFTEPLHAGTEFVLVENRTDWHQVELADSRRCWLPAKSVELIR